MAPYDSSPTAAPDDDLFGDSDMANLGDDNQDNVAMDELNKMAGIQDENTGFGNELDDILGEGGVIGGDTIDLDQINDQQAGNVGEKLSDAEDYGDISDNDLAEEEESSNKENDGNQLAQAALLSGIEEAAADYDPEMDDLFGDGPSSPLGEPVSILEQATQIDGAENANDLASEHGETDLAGPSKQSVGGLIEQQFVDPEWLEQQALLLEAKLPVTDPKQRKEDALKACKILFPAFSPDEVPYWNRIIKPRLGEYNGRKPLKPPKPVRPTKVHLEIAHDQRAAFNSAILQDDRYWADHDYIIAIRDEKTGAGNEQSYDSDDESEEGLPGDVTMADLEMICASFDTLSDIDESDAESLELLTGNDSDEDLFDEGLPAPKRPAKRQKLGPSPRDIISQMDVKMPDFDDPEELTEQIARKVILDLNDPLILVEEVDPATVRAKAQLTDPTKGSQNLKEILQNRFNYSNDAEYDLLKQKHQNKIRASLGNLTIEHSTPALRLQYPYFKIKLNTLEARTFHRKSISFGLMAFHLSRTNRIKRKHKKGKKAAELYPEAKDLSLDDNSTVVLVEYSEEHPMMLSRVGMGARLLNYYRKENKDDVSRPRLEVGEASVLLPEDKSPYSIFGNIDPGETVPTISNSMYRAPIFEHERKHQDFMLTRNETAVDGAHFYLRKTDHVFAAGQQFPSVMVPGPHSRVVTTAAKNRLKMICYRIIRASPSKRMSVAKVTRHFLGTNDMQNRQKMKEFLVYSKEHKEWEMKAGQIPPTDEELRQLVKPEDVCLLESMQVGQQYLWDAGFGGDVDEEVDDDKEDGTQSLEQELAPWKISKNFLNASQGKAMLTLHGQGDPSGRGEAFSFLKTSMKGGFKAIGESAMAKLTEKKDLGGHSYNVARQQRLYDESIRRIWDAQKAALSSKIELDTEMDDNIDGPDHGDQSNVLHRASKSEAATPATFRGRDDETGTSFSKQSGGSQGREKPMRIERILTNEDGVSYQHEQTERDPMVIKFYKKKYIANLRASNKLDEINLKGDGDFVDEVKKKTLQHELGRLQKNRERRIAREKAKGITYTASPSDAGRAGSPGSPSASTPVQGKQGTQRKCANCGQVGHIKTNKKCVDRHVSFAFSPSAPSPTHGSPALDFDAAPRKKRKYKKRNVDANVTYGFGPGT